MGPWQAGGGTAKALDLAWILESVGHAIAVGDVDPIYHMAQRSRSPDADRL
jgi:hypothetical protein